ncbi:MAG: enoyl-CoA hydratase/isomerase family protein [Candidatus Binatus sp.]|uniref:enoyl-CoA hydratase/isomerase family protein n=1 Tax=Candidatus Binatus sp. TaxID=2811406 RepID=UPI002716007D|nr:enoyl-CoA hydratase/isomerase family protein [Candidatus Binatus sp.]MDO8432197.1 enoyl-CoA hydratase/isomerase family protein [Candidatus Binatus sp.]
MYETINCAIEDGIGVVRLNRPDKLNAINPQMVAELRGLADSLASADLRALIFTGNGRAFSAGADISKLVEIGRPDEFLKFIERIQTAYNAIEDLPFPTIAAIDGIAFGGGCELALACDLRIMARDASLGVPEIKIGVLPGAGGTQRLGRMLPPAIAKRMIYFGDPLDSDAALRYGLINEVVEPGRAFETSLEWARRLAQLPPLAIRSAKMLVHGAQESSLKSGIESERQALAFLFGTEDRREGMRAFLEKRTPSFSGR